MAAITRSQAPHAKRKEVEGDASALKKQRAEAVEDRMQRIGKSLKEIEEMHTAVRNELRSHHIQFILPERMYRERGEKFLQETSNAIAETDSKIGKSLRPYLGVERMCEFPTIALKPSDYLDVEYDYTYFLDPKRVFHPIMTFINGYGITRATEYVMQMTNQEDPKNGDIVLTLWSFDVSNDQGRTYNRISLTPIDRRDPDARQATGAFLNNKEKKTQKLFREFRNGFIDEKEEAREKIVCDLLHGEQVNGWSLVKDLESL